MGVADNKSYKDQYHFTDNFFKSGDDLASLNVEKNINSTIKENPYSSNVEIEGGEMVLQPDLTALFKAIGKRHKSGGMDVKLRPNSFVFSDDKSLAIGEKDHDDFELKKMKDYSEATPAQVVKKNVDPKHYNTLVANITDIHKDELAKKSSAMMLQKYITTLGRVAFLQEKKKDFPQGLPDFSSGTAPVYKKDLENEIDEQKQYAKYGGNIYAPGGYVDPCPCGRDAQGNCLDCPDDVYKGLLPKARTVNSPLPGYNQLYKTPNEVLYGKFGDLKQRQEATKFMSNDDWLNFLKSETPEHRASRKSQYETPDDYIKTLIQPSAGDSGPSQQPQANDNPQPNPYYTPPQVPEIEATALGSKSADWQFTPWQRVSQGYNAAKYATANRYMPFRSQFNPSYVDPSLVNPEQTIAGGRGAFNKELSSLSTLNPIVRNAQAAAGYGEFLNFEPGVRSQYDNQNSQITNQFRQNNNQIANQARLTNMQNDQNYYRESIVGRQNFDNMKSYLGDQYMNNVLRDVETNQTLAYNLLTQNNPAYGYDWRTGKFNRNPKNILDVQSNGAQDELKNVMGVIDQIGDPYQKAQALTKLYGLKVFGPAISAQTGMKKGGKYYNPYK